MEEIIIGSEVLLKNEKDSRESMLVADIIDTTHAKCIWRDVNDVPQQKTYPISLLKLKPPAKVGYAAPAGGGSRNN